MGIAFTGDIYALVVDRLLQRQLHWQNVYHIVGEAVEILRPSLSARPYHVL
jgi:hypothetical protein